MTHPTPDAEPMLDLAAILARADAATPGPWVVSFPEIHSLGFGGHPTEVVWQGPFEGGGVEREADATFIAAARTDVPALVDALRVRDDEIAALRADRDALAKRVEGLEAATHSARREGWREAETYLRGLAAPSVPGAPFPPHVTAALAFAEVVHEYWTTMYGTGANVPRGILSAPTLPPAPARPPVWPGLEGKG